MAINWNIRGGLAAVTSLAMVSWNNSEFSASLLYATGSFFRSSIVVKVISSSIVNDDSSNQSWPLRLLHPLSIISPKIGLNTKVFSYMQSF
jgi:hypothetical protein